MKISNGLRSEWKVTAEPDPCCPKNDSRLMAVFRHKVFDPNGNPVAVRTVLPDVQVHDLSDLQKLEKEGPGNRASLPVETIQKGIRLLTQAQSSRQPI